MQVKNFDQQAGAASDFVGCLAHPLRLRILCALAEGELTIGELAQRIGAAQPALSHHLALLRGAHIVEARRSGQALLCRLAHPGAAKMIAVLAESFCPVRGV
jgi:ArsR family transcriptional regulator